MAESEIPTAPRDDEASATLFDANPDGNYYSNRQRTFLLVQNDHSSAALTVTIHEQRTCGHPHHAEEHGTIDATKVVPAGSAALFGPFGRTPFNDAQQRVHVTYSHVLEAAAVVVGVAALYEPGPAPALSS